MKSDDNFADLYHFTWCAQVAVKMAFSNGRTAPVTAVHLFLMRWLKTARTQKRFPRTVARDINYLITFGERHGAGSRLLSKVEFLYHSCEDVALQSDLFRLTYVTELLKDSNWAVGIQSAREWKKNISVPGNALHLPPTLSGQFDDDGWLLAPLPLRMTGDTEYARKQLQQYGLELHPGEDAGEYLLKAAART